MTLFALAQTAPAPTPTDLRPALFAAGGALIGIILTLLVQAFTQWRQRLHENQGRAFDIRLESYGELMLLLFRLQMYRSRQGDLDMSSPDDVAECNDIEEKAFAARQKIDEVLAPLMILSDGDAIHYITRCLNDIEGKLSTLEPFDLPMTELRTAIRKEIRVDRRRPRPLPPLPVSADAA